MKIDDLNVYLTAIHPGITFRNGSIDKNDDQNVGLYVTGVTPSNIAIGGIANTTYSNLPVSILVHWSEDFSECETVALAIYNSLFGLSDTTMNGVNVRSVFVLDSHPRDVGRDDNVCEMVIRINILYRR